MTNVYWTGSIERCDACRKPFEAVMYDAATSRGWGNLDQKCFEALGCSLGTGRGQKYEKQADGRWLKTGG